MRKVLAVILTICLVLTAFPLIASADSSAGPAALQRHVFFADYADQFNGAYLYGWEIQGDYFIDAPYEWPGIAMNAVDANENGDVMYEAVLPFNINYVIISDINGNQTVDIPLGERILVTLTGEVDDNLYYKVEVEELYDGPDPTLPDDSATHPTVPPDYNTVEEDLIVLNNSLDTFEDDIYICCRSGKKNGEETTLRTKMERFDTNGYGEGMYRFTMPEDMKYYYFTDNKKRTEELACNPNLISAHLYLSGDVYNNGEYRLYHILWSGVFDSAFTQGASHTLFDRVRLELCDPTQSPVTKMLSRYDELYEHQGSSGTTDWVLCRIEMKGGPESLATFRDIIGNRVVEHGAYFDMPFRSYYGLYDAADDILVPIDSGMLDEYDGLAQAFDKVGEGRMLGDLDGDDRITVIDATLIQRCAAKMRDYPEDDELGMMYHDHVIWYYSDFNRDGARSVLDATCIQRYLAGQTYPIG